MTAVDAQSITYNNAGQMTDDGTLTYSWDRGGRLLSAGNSSYEYNGFGNRLSQTVSAVVTDYLLDLQPGLSKVLAATTGANVDRFVHTRQGIHAQHDATNGWQWMIQDGLGSVRAVVDSSFDVDESRHYAPYGETWGVQGSSQTDFGFTGEPTDGNGLVHLRARYLNPALGLFPSLDPLEGIQQRPMSLNGYVYTEGNPTNYVDRSGLSIDRGAVQSGSASYSCNCGWIDWDHVYRGGPMFFLFSAFSAVLEDYIPQKENEFAESLSRFSEIQPLTEHTVNYFLNEHLERHPWEWGFRIILGVDKASTTIYLVDRTARVDHLSMKNSHNWDRIGWAAAMLISKDEFVETLHTVNDTVTLGLSNSSFSEEDLPSNALGMYLGLMRYFSPNYVPILSSSDPDPTSSNPEPAWEAIRRICGVFSKTDSLAVFDNFYGHGNGFVKGWRNWEPKLRPDNYQPTGCDVISQNCPHPPQWPTVVSDIINNGKASGPSRHWHWDPGDTWLIGSPYDFMLGENMNWNTNEVSQHNHIAGVYFDGYMEPNLHPPSGPATPPQ